MPAPFKPWLRWQFDWNRDGRYNHPESEVGADYRSHDLRWGTAADTPVGLAGQQGADEIVTVAGIQSDTATGSLVVYDSDGRFDPDNRNLRVNESQLRAPVPVRLLHDVNEVWRGIGIPEYGTAFRQVENFVWRLEGTFGERLRSQLEILSAYGTLLDVIDPDPGLSVSFATGEILPLGVVDFNGTRIKFYEAVARMAGGWMIENERGELAVHTMRNAFASPSLVLLDETFEPGDDALVAEAPGLVRTRMTLAAQNWVPVVDDADQRIAVSVGTTRYTLGASPAIVNFALKGGDTRRLDEWLTPVLSGNATAFVLNSSTARRSMSIRLFPTTQPAGEVQVSFRAHVSDLETINSRDVVLDSVEQTYKRRDLGLRPWLSASLTGVEGIIVPWLRNLSEPLRYVRVSYSEWQRSSSQLATLRAARPGAVIRMLVQTKQRGLEVVKVLVLAVRLTGAHNAEPIRTVYGVVVRNRPPRPIEALTAEAVSSTEAFVQLRSSQTSGTAYVDVTKVR